jgi:hypothetical protein
MIRKESSIIISLGKVYSILHEKFLEYRSNVDPVSSLLDEECNVDNKTNNTVHSTLVVGKVRKVHNENKFENGIPTANLLSKNKIHLSIN